MSLTFFIIVFLFSTICSMAWYIRKENKRFDIAFEYAVRHADLSTEAGRAYSDMATVIVLAGDGPVPDIETLRPKKGI